MLPPMHSVSALRKKSGYFHRLHKIGLYRRRDNVYHRMTLSGLFVQVVAVKYPKQNNTFVPVRGAGALMGLRVNGDAISFIDTNGPGGWIINDPLKV